MLPDSTVVEYKAGLSIVELDGVHHLPLIPSVRIMMAVSLVDVLDPGRYYPVYQLLLSMLDSLSIVRLSKTCRGLVELYRGAIRQEWNVDRLLCRFVAQPLALREVMRDHRAVISGELALSFFSRQCWPDHMDLFVDEGDGAVALCSYLETREGYRRREASDGATQVGRVSDPSVTVFVPEG